MAQWFQIRRLKTDNTFFDSFVRFVSFVYFQSTKNINFLGDYPLAIPTKFGSNWPSGFREEDKNVKAYGRQRRRTTDPK